MRSRTCPLALVLLALVLLALVLMLLALVRLALVLLALLVLALVSLARALFALRWRASPLTTPAGCCRQRQSGRVCGGVSVGTLTTMHASRRERQPACSDRRGVASAHEPAHDATCEPAHEPLCDPAHEPTHEGGRAAVRGKVPVAAGSSSARESERRAPGAGGGRIERRARSAGSARIKRRARGGLLL